MSSGKLFVKSELTDAEQEDSQDTEQEEHSSQNATDTLSQIMSMIKRMNVQDLQNHLTQFSSVLSNVQNVIQTFQRPNNPA